MAVAILFACTLGCSAIAYADAAAEKAAQAAARAWLALVDAGKYGESWEQAAAFFKKSITKEAWEKAVAGARKPLGAMNTRAFKRAKYSNAVPNAPKGEYVVIQFETSFAKKQGAIETVTPMLDKDKKWRVSGYFIK